MTNKVKVISTFAEFNEHYSIELDFIKTLKIVDRRVLDQQHEMFNEEFLEELYDIRNDIFNKCANGYINDLTIENTHLSKIIEHKFEDASLLSLATTDALLFDLYGYFKDDEDYRKRIRLEVLSNIFEPILFDISYMFTKLKDGDIRFSSLSSIAAMVSDYESRDEIPF